MTDSHPGSRRMLLGALIGAVAGLVAHSFFADSRPLAIVIDYVSVPLGQIFLRLLFMLVMPLVFAALVMGVCELELGSLARIAIRTMAYTVIVSFVAVAIGLTAVNLV